MRRSSLEAEFDEYFAARAPALRRTAYLIVRDWHTAEDLVQATFVKLYTAWPRIRQESLEAYARRALVNACISYGRKHRREVVTDDLPERATPGRPDAPIDLGGALELLTPTQRAVVALRFVDDLSVTEVAAVLGMAEGTVKSHTARAIATLRANLPELVLSEE